MPALGMAQETGRLLQWLKAEGSAVVKGEPLMEIETDKVSVEIEAPASGTLVSLSAAEGDDVPVGQTVALILGEGEALPARPRARMPAHESTLPAVTATPVARKLAADHGLDVRVVRPHGGRVQKADVLAYLAAGDRGGASAGPARLSPASPKARRLAAERSIELSSARGSGPWAAVLAGDVPASSAVDGGETLAVGQVWRVMVDRLQQSWSTVPHFYLVREVNVSRLRAWRQDRRRSGLLVPSVTDLLVRLSAAALTEHPRLNGSWTDGSITLHPSVNVGLAVAVDDGLVVPVIHAVERLSLEQIAERREDLVERARSGKLRPEDLRDGTFTISNLGMFGVDAFDAIVNPPQAAVLAVGRIADRVVPVHGKPGIQPMMVLTLSVDHRVADGACAARFLGTLASSIEEPTAFLTEQTNNR